MSTNKVSEKIAKVYVHVISAIGIGSLVVFVVFLIYIFITKGIPSFTAAVVEWGNDTTTALAEHHWQATDAMLYGGMAMILVIRFRNTLLNVWDKYSG